MATVPGNRFEATGSANDATEEKDLEYKISVFHQDRDDYIKGEIPHWFGPHADRIALMCKCDNFKYRNN